MSKFKKEISYHVSWLFGYFDESQTGYKRFATHLEYSLLPIGEPLNEELVFGCFHEEYWRKWIMETGKTINPSPVNLLYQILTSKNRIENREHSLVHYLDIYVFLFFHHENLDI